MPAALWALVIGAFGIGTTEFVIAGLLPAIAADFGVSIPVAAYLATSYALGVFVGAPVIIVLGNRVSKKTCWCFWRCCSSSVTWSPRLRQPLRWRWSGGSLPR